MCKTPTASRKTPSELKRQDLKGNFPCTSCGQIFQHESSLNRHRANVHSAEYECRECNTVIAPGTTVRKHMKIHGFETIFTCGCCNWSFASKKLMSDHVAVLRNNGNVHDVPALAISIHTPGSLKKPRGEKRPLSGSDSSSSGTRSSSEEAINPVSIFDQLSALSIDALYIETFEHALSFIFGRIQFKTEQLEDLFVVLEIIKTGQQLAGSGGGFQKV